MATPVAGADTAAAVIVGSVPFIVSRSAARASDLCGHRGCIKLLNEYERNITGLCAEHLPTMLHNKPQRARDAERRHRRAQRQERKVAARDHTRCWTPGCALTRFARYTMCVVHTTMLPLPVEWTASDGIVTSTTQPPCPACAAPCGRDESGRYYNKTCGGSACVAATCSVSVCRLATMPGSRECFDHTIESYGGPPAHLRHISTAWAVPETCAYCERDGKVWSWSCARTKTNWILCEPCIRRLLESDRAASSSSSSSLSAPPLSSTPRPSAPSSNLPPLPPSLTSPSMPTTTSPCASSSLPFGSPALSVSPSEPASSIEPGAVASRPSVTTFRSTLRRSAPCFVPST